MATSRWRAVAAGATVVLSAAVGVVTNIVTAKWNVVLFVVLVSLVVLGTVLQVAVTQLEGGDTAAGSQGPVLRARASGGSRIMQAGRDITLNSDPSPLDGRQGTDREHS